MESEVKQQLADKHDILQSKLDKLLDVTILVNKNSSKKVLFNNFKNILLEDLKIDKFLFFFNDISWDLIMNEGVDVVTANAITPLTSLLEYTEIAILDTNKSEDLIAFDIIIPIYNKKSIVAFLLLANPDDQESVNSPIIEHLKFIQTLGNIIVVALENKQLLKSQIRQLGMQKEMDLAQKMHAMLIPKNLPNNEQLKVKAFYQPHHEIGGDYYDIIKISKYKTAICIADISGNGISAALLMANFQATLHALLPLDSDLEKLILAANKKVIAFAGYEKFITLFLAIYDSKENTLSYINAGHQPAILYRDNDYQLLNKGCTVLGMFNELPDIEVGKVNLKPNDTLYCFTDGISEFIIDGNKQLGVNGIINYISKFGNQIEVVVDNISKLTKSDTMPKGKIDDVTFLAILFCSQASA